MRLWSVQRVSAADRGPQTPLIATGRLYADGERESEAPQVSQKSDGATCNLGCRLGRRASGRGCGLALYGGGLLETSPYLGFVCCCHCTIASGRAFLSLACLPACSFRRPPPSLLPLTDDAPHGCACWQRRRRRRRHRHSPPSFTHLIGLIVVDDVWHRDSASTHTHLSSSIGCVNMANNASPSPQLVYHLPTGS